MKKKNFKETIKNLQNQNSALLSLLKLLEWSFEPEPGGKYCMVCGGTWPKHENNCEVESALAKFKLDKVHE